jgi:sulfatase maturation enzyme AslB (radical SAM superfamily)
MATGLVHACACIDVNASLQMGDLNKQPLSEILSTKNQQYMDLIVEQKRGEFREVCQGCAFYRSIYHQRSQDRKESIAMRSIAEY